MKNIKHASSKDIDTLLLEEIQMKANP